MSFTNRICQRLHQEHDSTIALAGRLEHLMVRFRDDAPDISDSVSARFLGDLSTDISGEVERHFAFEEDELFTYLVSVGEPAIGMLLTEEHEVLRPLGAQISALAGKARDRRLEPSEWSALRRAGQEFCERIRAHVEKEEMGLLPLLEEHMDPQTEERLYEAYVANA